MITGKGLMMEGTTEWFFEEVTDRIGVHVLASKIRDVTPEDIAEARRLHALGKCPHNVIFDTLGYMYDFRECAICGKGLGTV